MDGYVKNLLDCYEASSGNGEKWYRESQRVARDMRRTYGTPQGMSAGIIAALSPRVQWKVNVRNAHIIASGGVCGGLRTSVQKAYRIRHGERPLDVLSGPKTRAFYRAIMGDEDAAVIDCWMLRAMGWPTESVSAKQYEVCAAALREAATLTPLSTANFQAVVWTHVRGGGD